MGLPLYGPSFLTRVRAHAQDTETVGQKRLTTRGRFTDQRKLSINPFRVHVHDLPVMILVRFILFP